MVKKDAESRDLGIRKCLPQKGHLDWLLGVYSSPIPPRTGRPSFHPRQLSRLSGISNKFPEPSCEMFWPHEPEVTVCYKLRVYVPQNLWVEIQTSNVMVLKAGALGGNGSWGWSPHEWDSCPYKRHPREFFCPFQHVRTQRGSGHVNQEAGPYQISQLFTLGLPRLQSHEK